MQLADFADPTPRDARDELRERTQKIVDAIVKGGASGAEIMVFPEMSLVRYDQRYVQNLSTVDMDAAEDLVATACEQSHVWAIVGAPRFFMDNTTNPPTKKHWNSAVVFDGNGRKVFRQAKLHTGPDAVAGRWMGTFQGPGNITASVLVRGERRGIATRYPYCSSSIVYCCPVTFCRYAWTHTGQSHIAFQ